MVEKFKKCCSLGTKGFFKIWFAAQKSPFLIEIQTIFNPECLLSNLRSLIRFINFFYFVVRVFESTEKFNIANIANAVRSFNHQIERITQP